jgi:hypothetical protein
MGNIEPVIMLEYERKTDYMLLNERSVDSRADSAIKWKVASCISGKTYFVHMLIVSSIFAMTVLF